jgi:hypothetical protein
MSSEQSVFWRKNEPIDAFYSNRPIGSLFAAGGGRLPGGFRVE